MRKTISLFLLLIIHYELAACGTSSRDITLDCNLYPTHINFIEDDPVICNLIILWGGDILQGIAMSNYYDGLFN